jgi:hypothetical protein
MSVSRLSVFRLILKGENPSVHHRAMDDQKTKKEGFISSSIDEERSMSILE